MRTREQGRRGKKRQRSPLFRSALVLSTVSVALIALFLVPSPNRNQKSGIELVGSDATTERYGPELPITTVAAYPAPVVESVVLPEGSTSDEDTVYVYAADDQECYHLSTCKFAYASSHRFTVEEALLLGYKPCGRCNPPIA